MAFYYVDDTGTATADAGRFATGQTGAFTNATSYASVYDVFAGGIPTTAPVSGDTIVLAHDSLESWAANKDLSISDGVNIASASASARETYLKGATVQTTTGGDLTLLTSVSATCFYSKGVNFHSNDELYLGTNEGCFVDINDCAMSLTTSSTGDHAYIGVSTVPLDGTKNKLTDVDITTTLKTSGGFLWPGGGSVFELTNVTCDGRLFHTTAGLGGATIDINSSDLTNHDTTLPMINWTSATDDRLNLTMSRCKLPSNLIIVTSTITYKNIYADIYSCDIGDGYHYFEHHRYTGKVLESTTVKRTGGAHYDQANPTTTLFSAEFQPNANVVAYTQPLRIAIKHFELDLTSANTLTFHLAMQDTAVITPSTVTNDKYWIEIVQNSDTATSKALGITIDTKPSDILATPTALANVATTWTGRTLTYEDEFQIPVTTTVVSGMTNGQVTAYFCCAESVATREIFVCPNPVITV